MTRTSTQTAPRIGPLAKLPLFFDLAGKRALVAGDGEGALWKAELLSAAGARVRVCVGADGDARWAARWRALADQPVAGPIEVLARHWSPDDLDGAALAIGDLEVEDGARLAAAARARSVPVNVVDKPALCDFQIGSIVNRSPVVVAISTDGAAPMLGQSIRARIEAVLPPGLAGWADAARRWRGRLKRRLSDPAARRAFWERFTAAAWAAPDRRATDRDFAELVAGGGPPPGSVTLVGAGPGDPELLTLKAVRALQTASVILFDDLVAPGILELARREARRVSVGKRARGPSVRQGDIDAELVRLALAGERVVRLKGGDPLIFGRATEELDACHAAGVPVAVIPGITAAQGAAAALGFSLTERAHARRVQFVTGHGTGGALPGDLDWRALADPNATTVVYMPRATLAEFASRAIAAGLDPLTPALAVAAATTADQTHERAVLAALPRSMARLPAGAPVLVVIGHVARMASGVAAAAA